MKKLTIFALTAIVALSALNGCKKTQTTDNKKETTKKAPESRKVVEAPKKAAKAPEIKDWVLKGYEDMRLALAADKFDATKKGAEALIKKSKTAKGDFTALAKAATKVLKSKGIEAARVVFGDVSKQVIAYIIKTKKTDGVTTYSCPMAKGFKKWIQLDANMANPYMGTRMLKCGSKAKLSL